MADTIPMELGHAFLLDLVGVLVLVGFGSYFFFMEVVNHLEARVYEKTYYESAVDHAQDEGCTTKASLAQDGHDLFDRT